MPNPGFQKSTIAHRVAAVAELADAPDLGSGVRKNVEVRVLSAASLSWGSWRCRANWSYLLDFVLERKMISSRRRDRLAPASLG